MSMQFHIDNMVCGGCVKGVTRAIQAVDSHAQVLADPETKLVEVTTSAPREQITAALREADFPPRES